ncbi:MAG: cyclic nucleotide-binding domain-containing protein [Pirellulales bacterium]|nr:cyclic nucleotide-binding domain-containing protein [Pirellulales bacterium]
MDEPATNHDTPAADELLRRRSISAAEQCLRRCDLCRGLDAAEIRSLAENVRLVRFYAGEVVCRQHEHGNCMYVVVRGRVRVSIEEPNREFRLLDHLGRGEHFGEMAMLTAQPHMATITAVVDTELLELDLAHFERLLTTIPAFGANLSRALGFRLQRVTVRRPRRWQPTIVGLVNTSPRTQQLVKPLARLLVGTGGSVEILTDRVERLMPDGGYLVERIPEGLDVPAKTAAIRERLAHVAEHHERVFLDVTFGGYGELLGKVLEPCEQVWWLIESSYAEAAFDALRKLLMEAPALAERIHLVWIEREEERFAPLVPDDIRVAPADFKVVLSASGEATTRAQRHSLLRLIRYLRGTRVGLALSGGGARGMAHLGVLRAFEREDICIDMLAGTSSGALTGISYAGGWEAEYALENFQRVLTPPRHFRMMPGGRSWYLLSKFRTGAWDAMLRPYAGDARIEQLRVPFYVVAVDLVSGKQVIRERGDAIHAVLESINLPIMSHPILRDGMALVDGGVLNSLPADILPERGADLVIGVDVTWKLAPRFGGNVPSTPTHRMRRPGMIETFLRLSEVQDAGLAALRAHYVDLLITPDASAFEFGDFSRAHELANVGEAAAAEVMPQLKQLIADLESR